MNVLIRPDQQVAWRGAELPAGGAAAVLDPVLGGSVRQGGAGVEAGLGAAVRDDAGIRTGLVDTGLVDTGLVDAGAAGE
jgi:hypothetical protein